MKSVKDVERFSIGGVFGYNFGVYSFDISRVDQGSKTTEALLTKLRKGRIDLAIGYPEVFRGLAKIGRIDLTGLEYVEIPESTPLVFHAMVTRKEGGKQLLKIVNDGIEQLKTDGYYQRVFRKYGVASDR